MQKHSKRQQAQTEIELRPDGWEQFRAAVTAAAKGGPKHRLARKKSATKTSGTKYLFDVPIVRTENVQLWHEYWDRKKPTLRAKKANRDASLGQMTQVRARNAQEAKRVAEKETPGFTAVGTPTRHR